ncbi:MAG: NPCBM/NEW2 domain-containing protein [Verrucomicrobiota bacterium JB023]|nr:NPCBM/NEW2 domain-containing protein [Verrucomicrobiota bacterium JB023]
MPKAPLFTFLFLLAAAICAIAESEDSQPVLTESEREQSRRALSILRPWQEEDPVTSTHRLQVVYWTPSDREPATGYRERLTRIMESLQDFYRSEMERNGFGPATFPLAREESGELTIHLVKGRRPAKEYGKKSGSVIRQECLPSLRAAGLDPARETVVIFCHLANWNAKKKTFTHNSPDYAGGTHRGGTVWQVDYPRLDPNHLSVKRPVIQDRRLGKLSLGEHNSVLLGALAQKLGHAFALPHNRADADTRRQGFRAVMGDKSQTYGATERGGESDSFLTFAHALRLASHPLFSRSAKELASKTSIELNHLDIKPTDKGFRFSGRIRSELPVYGLIAYLDPEGHSDYNARVTTAIPDKQGNFALSCRQLVPGKPAQMRLVALHANGASSQQTYSYSVDQAGRPEIASLQLAFALSPVVEAVNARDQSKLQSAFDQLHARLGPGPELDRANHIAKRLSHAPFHQPHQEPAALDSSISRITLTETASSKAKVGFGEPTYDHLPKPSLLLEAGGHIYAHGIYAHAPARHEYNLDGKWTSFEGHCGLADGMPGSVVFIIKGDDKELYRSPVANPGQVFDFNVDVTGIKSLRLLTSDGGDGRGSDWGLWLEPTLTR